MKPLVSIIIPCFNDGGYLNEAIQSCLNQTYTNFEIIIINDCSTDEKTIKILKEIITPKTTVIHLNENKGVAASRNIGITAANGIFVLPLDSDDTIEPSYLERTVEYLEVNPHIGFVSTGVRHFGEQVGDYIPDPFSIKKLLYHNLYVVTSLFRRKAWEEVGGYNEKMLIGYEDWDFWISLAKKGWQGATIPEILFNYRVKKNSRLETAKKNHYTLLTYIIENHKELYTSFASKRNKDK